MLMTIDDNQQLLATDGVLDAMQSLGDEVVETKSSRGAKAWCAALTALMDRHRLFGSYSLVLYAYGGVYSQRALLQRLFSAPTISRLVDDLEPIAAGDAQAAMAHAAAQSLLLEWGGVRRARETVTSNENAARGSNSYSDDDDDVAPPPPPPPQQQQQQQQQQQPSCPAGHRLQRADNVADFPDGVTCDGCKRAVTSAPLFSCRSCDYDVCGTCITKL
jgi:hypothetical protein